MYGMRVAFGFLGIDTLRVRALVEEKVQLGAVNETLLEVPKTTFGQARAILFLSIQTPRWNPRSRIPVTLGEGRHYCLYQRLQPRSPRQPIFTVFLGEDGFVQGDFGGVFTYGGEGPFFRKGVCSWTQ